MTSQAPPDTTLHVDIVCRVVDNFGDAAVALRLARILTLQEQCVVRLLIDRADVLARLLPAAAAGANAVPFDGVEVRDIDVPIADPGDVVIETFGCGLPDWLRAALSGRTAAWLNLEYLSAESWIEGCHQLASPRGEGMPVCYYFFPGFTAATGGLLREAGLVARRRRFQESAIATDAFWASLGVADKAAGELRISMFTYPDRWPAEFFSALASCATIPLHVLLAEGVMPVPVEAFCGGTSAGCSRTVGRLTVTVIPFLSQQSFDDLLWACDLNIVRGEDSFVRAQLSGVPMLWDIYPQSEDAHRVKLEAFLNRLCANWPTELGELHRATSLQLIDRADGLAGVLMRWSESHERFKRYFEEWSEVLDALPELGHSVGIFARKLLECRPS